MGRAQLGLIGRLAGMDLEEADRAGPLAERHRRERERARLPGDRGLDLLSEPRRTVVESHGVDLGFGPPHQHGVLRQNGFTITMTTITTRSSVGTSLAIR